MSGHLFGRETHWVIVHTDAAQPWHARLVSNYRTIMTSEKYARRASALRAIELAAPEWLASKTPLEVDERTPRCQFVSPTPWGPAQCCLPVHGEDYRHAYSPSEAMS